MKPVVVAFGALLITACNSGGSGSDSSGDTGASGGASSGSVPPDADRDGFAGSTDCNDNDANAWRTVSVYADSDGDGVGAGPIATVCVGATVPAAYSSTSTDCADNDPTVHTTMSYAARDVDGDTYVFASAGTVCGNGAALPPTYLAAVGSVAADCDDANATLWRLAELYDDVDRDGVGHGPVRSLCLDNNTPAGLAASSFDCAAQDATKWRMVVVYADVDGDGVGSGARQPVCMGSSPPTGSSLLGFDPLDTKSDPASALVSDFDLNFPSLVVEENYSNDHPSGP